jgi:hypothetical protein
MEAEETPEEGEAEDDQRFLTFGAVARNLAEVYVTQL